MRGAEPDDRGGLVIIGGGGHAKVIAEAARAAEIRVVGFVDDDPAAALAGLAPRLGNLSVLTHTEFSRRNRVIIGVGDIALRSSIAAKVSGSFATVIHPRAYVSPSAAIGHGVFIAPFAVVHAGAKICDHASVNTSAVVEHDCVVGVNSHIAPGAVLGGQVRVGDNSLIGLGARVLPGVTVGCGCVVGAGAAVVSEVPDGALVVGVPARVVER